MNLPLLTFEARWSSVVDFVIFFGATCRSAFAWTVKAVWWALKFFVAVAGCWAGLLAAVICCLVLVQPDAWLAPFRNALVRNATHPMTANEALMSVRLVVLLTGFGAAALAEYCGKLTVEAWNTVGRKSGAQSPIIQGAMAQNAALPSPHEG